MKLRIPIFVHALAVVLLQIFPETIVLRGGTGEGYFYYEESFLNMKYLWGMGAFAYPVITVLSTVTLIFALVLLISKIEWCRIVILVTAAIPVLLMMAEIIMFWDANCITPVLAIIFILLISECVITAVSLAGSHKKG